MIAEIEFGGKKLELVYGLPAVRAIYEQLDKVTFLASETYSIVSLVNIVYEGYVNGCLVNRTVPEITFREIFEWVEDNAASGEILKAVNAFNDSKYIKKAAELNEEEKKKIDWEEVEKTAYGELALKPWEYNRISWREYQMMLEGWEQRNSRAWEHTRLIVWTQMAINRDPKKSFPSIREYMPLRSDSVIDEEVEKARLQKVLDDHKKKVKNRK